jgi:hypothetical protein
MSRAFVLVRAWAFCSVPMPEFSPAAPPLSERLLLTEPWIFCSCEAPWLSRPAPIPTTDTVPLMLTPAATANEKTLELKVLSPSASTVILPPALTRELSPT